MPTIEHSVLTSTELHEPKGADSASLGMFYVSDGAGSGSWEFIPTGWGFYQDAGSAQVINTTAAKLSIDGAGALTNNTYLPYEIRGSDTLWDTTADKITPISVGDGYDVRLDLPITATTTANELTLQFDLGGGATPTVVAINRFVGLGKTPPYTVSLGFPLVILNSLGTTNGIQIFASTDAGTCTITNPSILIKRDFAGSI